MIRPRRKGFNDQTKAPESHWLLFISVAVGIVFACILATYAFSGGGAVKRQISRAIRQMTGKKENSHAKKLMMILAGVVVYFVWKMSKRRSGGILGFPDESSKCRTFAMIAIPICGLTGLAGASYWWINRPGTGGKAPRPTNADSTPGLEPASPTNTGAYDFWKTLLKPTTTRLEVTHSSEGSCIGCSREVGEVDDDDPEPLKAVIQMKSTTHTCDYNYCEECLAGHIMSEIKALSKKMIRSSELPCSCQKGTDGKSKALFSEKAIASILKDRKMTLKGKSETARIIRENLIFRGQPGFRTCPHCKYSQVVLKTACEEYKGADNGFDAHLKSSTNIKIRCSNRRCKEYFCGSDGREQKWKNDGSNAVEETGISLADKLWFRKECLDGKMNRCPVCKMEAVMDSGCNYVECKNPKCESYDEQYHKNKRTNFCITCGIRSSSYHEHSNGFNGFACIPTFIADNWEGFERNIIREFPKYKLSEQEKMKAKEQEEPLITNLNNDYGKKVINGKWYNARDEYKKHSAKYKHWPR